jgi:iron complex transport system ATP-binding protein
MNPTVLKLTDVGVTIDGNQILANVDLTVKSGERWVILGPNGGGKSTLLRLAGLAQHPTVGTLKFLGNTLGRCDVRPLRARIGTCSASLVDSLRPDLSARDVVKCAVYGALEPWWHTYSDEHHDRADALLADVGLDGFGARRFDSLSSGERQRAILARSLMPNPDLLLLDEPMAGLDLAGRENLIAALDTMGGGDSGQGPATLLVTHHVEDIPPSFNEFLAIGSRSHHASGPNGNGVVARGPIDETLTPELIEALFGVSVELTHHDRRWQAQAKTRGG